CSTPATSCRGSARTSWRRTFARLQSALERSRPALDACPMAVSGRPWPNGGAMPYYLCPNCLQVTRSEVTSAFDWCQCGQPLDAARDHVRHGRMVPEAQQLAERQPGMRRERLELVVDATQDAHLVGAHLRRDLSDRRRQLRGIRHRREPAGHVCEALLVVLLD